MRNLKQSIQQLNWRGYTPADEREQQLFREAYRLSYRTLAGILTLSPLVFHYAHTMLLTTMEAFITSAVYVFCGFLLAEWVGGRVFANQDVSFTNPRVIRWYDKDEGVGIGWMILYVLTVIFLITVYYFVTVPKI